MATAKTPKKTAAALVSAGKPAPAAAKTAEDAVHSAEIVAQQTAQTTQAAIEHTTEAADGAADTVSRATETAAPAVETSPDAATETATPAVETSSDAATETATPAVETSPDAATETAAPAVETSPDAATETAAPAVETSPDAATETAAPAVETSLDAPAEIAADPIHAVAIVEKAADEASDTVLRGVSPFLDFGRDNAILLISAGNEFVLGLHEISLSLIDWSVESRDKSVAAGQAILSAKTVEEVLGLSRSLAQEGLEQFLKEGSELSALSSKLIEETIVPLPGRLAAAVEKLASHVA